ncbi:Riboflavin transporter MCH5 [Grifola frondosa]|uniref:Riboflavin transporter MCH5 n=1 Tax=Grifola frondosa TaxID=5627 RepID=A0A1C7MKF1_GRIFR|nr:Riboflavin transporter MCH5 [Grifola frondosa]
MLHSDDMASVGSCQKRGSAIQVLEAETKLAESRWPDGQVSFDSGHDAWLTMIGGWLVAFCTFGAASSFGVYQAIYTLQNTSTPSNISWIGSLQFFLTFSVGLPAGKLLDAGYFHHIQIGGALLCVFSWFMLSLADTTKYYQIILSQGVGVGLGSGLMYSPVLSVQAHHWKRRRALAMGIVLSGSSFGGIVLPIMLNKLLHSSAGFAWGVRASAFLILGLLTIANLCMRTRYPPEDGTASSQRRSTVRILHDLPHWVAVIGSTLMLFGLYTPYFYLQLFVNIHGLSPTLAFYSVATLNASSFFGRTMLNFAADNVGHFNCNKHRRSDCIRDPIWLFLRRICMPLGSSISYAVEGPIGSRCSHRIRILLVILRSPRRLAYRWRTAETRLSVVPIDCVQRSNDDRGSILHVSGSPNCGKAQGKPACLILALYAVMW